MSLKTYGAISAGQLTAMRTGGGHVLSKRILNTVPIVPLATATVAATPVGYPIFEIALSSPTGFSDVKAGMMFFIGNTAGAWDVGVGIVRATPTSDSPISLQVDQRDLGDPGAPGKTDTHFDALQTGQHITVIKFYPLYGELSRLVSTQEGEGTFYKQFNIAYTNQLQHLAPVCNIGSWRRAFVDPVSGKASFTFTNSTSLLFGSGNAIESSSWDSDGGSYTAGTSSSNTITLEFDPGFYIVENTITDTYGGESTARALVWADEYTGTNAPFSLRYGLEMGNLRSDPQGTRMRARVTGQDAADELFPGCAVLYTEEPKFGSTTGTEVLETFAGYLHRHTETPRGSVKIHTYEFAGPMIIAQEIPNPQHQITQTSTPTTWAESATSNPVAAVLYLLRYHAPALLENHDLMLQTPYSTFEQLKKKTFVWQMEGIGQQVLMVDQLSLGNTGSKVDGSICMSLYPHYRPAAERDAWTTRATITTSDYLLEGVVIKRRERMRTAYNKGYGYGYDESEVTPHGAIAPGHAQAQANSKPTMPTFIVEAANGQKRTQEIVGAHWARDNSAVERITLPMVANFDFCDPADLSAQFLLDIPPLARPDASYVRALPVAVNRSYRTTPRGIIKSVTNEFEPITKGQLGKPIPVKTGGAGGNFDWGWIIDDGFLFDIDIPAFDFGWADTTAYRLNNYGLLGYTANVLAERVKWIGIKNNALGVIKAVRYNGSGGRLVIATWDSEAELVRIYQSDTSGVVGDDVTWDLLNTISITDNTFNGRLALRCSDTDPSDQALFWYQEDGTHWARTLDNWTSISNASVSVYDANDGALFGLRPVGESETGRFIVSEAPNGSGYRLYYATGTGSVTEVTGLPSDDGYSREPARVLHWNQGSSFYTTIDFVSTTPVSEAINTGFTWQYLSNNARLDGEDHALVWTSQDENAIDESVVYGYHARITLPQYQEGKFVDVSRIQLPLTVGVRYNPDEGDPPGSGGSPYQYYPPGQPGSSTSYGGYSTADFNMPFRCRYLVRNKDGEIIYNSGFETFDVVDDGTPTYLPSPSGFRWINIVAGHSFDDTFVSDLEDVWAIEVELTSTEPRNWGAGWFPMLVSFAPVTRVDASPNENGVGGPTVTITNEIVDGRRLMFVSAYRTTPTWFDYTPADGRAPMQPGAFFLNPLDSTELICVGTNAAGDRRVYISDDGGQTWDLLQDLPDNVYTRAKRFGAALALYGNARFDISDNEGVTVFDRLGDWDRSVGPIGDSEEILFPNDNPFNW